MDAVVAADEGRESRQVGVIDMQGRSAQWTGKRQYGSEKEGDWVHMRKGATFAVQGNSLVSTAVVDAVADTMQASEGSVRTLADRLIEALTAGHTLGGDGRHGETQSAAVVVADPREGRSRRPDKITVNINVCEHPEPLDELRRIYSTAAETLGFRRLEQFMGRDVLQLKLMLHALGYYRPDEKAIALTGPGAAVYTEEAVKALDAFRAAQQWGTTVPGLRGRARHRPPVEPAEREGARRPDPEDAARHPDAAVGGCVSRRTCSRVVAYRQVDDTISTLVTARVGTLRAAGDAAPAAAGALAAAFPEVPVTRTVWFRCGAKSSSGPLEVST